MTSREIQVAVIALFTGFAIGFLGHMAITSMSCKNYSYVNQSLACGEKRILNKESYAMLENELVDFIEEKRISGEASEVAVYFRDLKGGQAFGLQEDEAYSPASLLKLPFIITFFSLQEDIPDLLQTKIRFEQEVIAAFPPLPQIEESSVQLIEGKAYTIEELMRNAIVYSDNPSYYVLVEYLNRVVPQGQERILRTFQELGIIDPRDIAEEVVTVHGYASLFRVLYNTSYLSMESSEKLLGWLGEVVYDKGVAAGLPEGTPFANKFGERELPDGSKQLHDCGIIYYPGNPYVLCVMTKGSDWNALGGVVGEISRRVYEEVDSRRL